MQEPCQELVSLGEVQSGAGMVMYLCTWTDAHCDLLFPTGALATLRTANVADRKELDWQAQHEALNDLRCGGRQALNPGG